DLLSQRDRALPQSRNTSSLIAFMGWFVARDAWISTFTGEDTRGADARDVATEDVILLQRQSDGRLRPMWHSRFENDDYGVLRSVAREMARTSTGALLLSIVELRKRNRRLRI